MENTAGFLQDPANRIRKSLAIGEHLSPRPNVNLFRGGHGKGRVVANRSPSRDICREKCFQRGRVFARLSLPVILNFSVASRHEKGARVSPQIAARYIFHRGRVAVETNLNESGTYRIGKRYSTLLQRLRGGRPSTFRCSLRAISRKIHRRK